jgi:catechol 2,3-dioxygenase-like lactoylglutathione lyase family enzyme
MRTAPEYAILGPIRSRDKEGAMKAPELTFGHFGIYVTDLDKMVEFYTRVLGFTVTDRGPIRDTELAFMSRDPTEHHQLVLALGRPRDLAFNIVNQMSFRLPSLDALRDAHTTVAAEGITDTRVVSHGNAWSVYFHDPEGNRIEFYVHTPFYTPQPYAEPLDLGASNEEILRRTEAECRARPRFQTREAWSASVAARMRAN